MLSAALLWTSGLHQQPVYEHPAVFDHEVGKDTCSFADRIGFDESSIFVNASRLSGKLERPGGAVAEFQDNFLARVASTIVALLNGTGVPPPATGLLALLLGGFSRAAH